MWKKRLLIVVGAVAALVLYGCSTTNSNREQYQPTSEYPAEITGYVTITDRIVTTWPKSGKQRIVEGLGTWWIVEVSVRNISYELPITSLWNESLSMPVGEEHWIWSTVVDEERWGGIRYDNQSGAFTPSPMNVKRGQTGTTTIRFRAPPVSPNDAQISYRGQQPYSYGGLVTRAEVASYDWDSKEPSAVIPTVDCPAPQGTYSSSALGMVATVEFEGDRLAATSSIFGKRVFRYDILRSCNEIRMTNVVTGEVEVHYFKYSEEDGYVAIGKGPDGSPLTYWKDS